MSWGNHFPIKIFVDQTMKDVLDAEKNPLINIEYDWDVLTKASPILAFSLEIKKGAAPGAPQVSFYSFLTWYLYQFNGILEYDYVKNAYKILGKKSDGGAPLEIAQWMMTPPDCTFPEPLRYQERSINHSAENKDDTDQENPNGFKSVRRDAFDAVNYTHFPEQVTPKVESKLVREKPSIRFSFKELSDTVDLDKLVPGAFIEIKKNTLLGETWCDDPIFKGKPYRLTKLSFHAVPTNTFQEVERLIQEYELEILVEAEAKEETYVERPPFQEPVYPFSIPGKIFSEVGDKEQTTHNIAKQEKVPLGQYQVKVPLVADDKKVVVPFMPDFSPGQHYFPLCKDQQVMLAVYFRTAKIERILDWQPLARLPLDTQANQIVFASNGKDKSVIEKHEFENGQNSVFTIKQSSSPDQTQTFKIQEKEITITVEEKGKNTVLIKFNRETGLFLQVKDDVSGVIQQSEYNGTAITHLSQKGGDKSIIVQTPESIAFECKQYSIKCDEAVIDAKKGITQKAGNKIYLEAPAINGKGAVDFAK